MRTITTTTNVYKFTELSDAAKEHAVSKLYDCNTQYEWWDSDEDDAANIGLKIAAFNIDHRTISGKLTMPVGESIAKVLTDHGPTCDTHKLALKYNALIAPHQAVIDAEEDDDAIDIANDVLSELEDDYQHAMLEEYLSILCKQWEYLASEEAIIETIEANEYEFNEDGNLA